MIRVLGLGKSYGDRNAIDNLNFMIKSGEVVGFLGPNGAGKTTTLKIITGFMPASRGKVIVDGNDVFEDPMLTKEKIGYLPEQPPVYNDMKVQDYLTFVAKIKKVKKYNIQQFVNEALDKTQLNDIGNRLILNLSKGYKQRVGLAAALVAKPKILILDEPTVGLDPNQVLKFRQLILSLKGDHTILLSTHILSEVQAVCDRIVIINEGEIVAEESLQQVKINTSREMKYRVVVTRNREQLMRDLNDKAGVRQVKIVNDQIEVSFNVKQLSIESLASLIIESNAGLIEFNPLMSPVESLFSDLTKRQEVQI